MKQVDYLNDTLYEEWTIIKQGSFLSAINVCMTPLQPNYNSYEIA